MAAPTKVVDPAFEGVGKSAGLEVWRIENFQPVPVPKSEIGKFYTGDSYIILKTTILKSGAYQYDAHFWLGNATSQDEAGTAAIKTVELDAALGDRAVQYREVQGHESDKFLSYFKPCIIPLEGGVASGFKQVEKEKFEARLFTCKGRHVVRVQQVPYARSSLNHDDVFILDTESKIYQFNGSTSSIQERAKALGVVQYIKETYHDGTCDVAVIDDDTPNSDTDTEEFWSLFGGFAPIGNREVSEENVSESPTEKLYIVEEGQLNQVEAVPLTKDLLDSNKCFVLDSGAEIYVWTGRGTALEEKKAASVAAEKYLSSQNKPKHTSITRVIEGSETMPFRTNFDSWPSDGETSASEDGRAMLKQHKSNGKGPLREAPKKEEVPPLFDSNGKLEVFRVNGSAKTAVAPEEVGKFFSGDCYIVLYTYARDRKDDYFLCSWIGKHSTKDDQKAASHLSSQMASMYKEKPVQGRIVEGREPPEFIGLFHNFTILKGGLSSGFQKKLADEGLADETYNDDGVALFQVQGTGPHNSKAVQVQLVSLQACVNRFEINVEGSHMFVLLSWNEGKKASFNFRLYQISDKDSGELNSSYCYILISSDLLCIWNGNSSSSEEQEVAVKLAEFLKPGAAPEILKEGSEPSTFWNALGGEKSYASHCEAKKIDKDPRLFACSIVKGKLEAKEVFNFSQNDLLSEDVMVLDTHKEVFAWVGQNADPKEKQQASDMAQKYVEQAARHEGLPLDVPLYKISEGNEPFFFTQHFDEWDAVHATMEGNSFQRRLSVLLGRPAEHSNISGTSQRGEVSNVADATGHAVQPSEYISYERLKAGSDDQPPGVDPERRESYLSPKEFKELFGMDSEQFYKLPKWKQEMQKKTLDLF